MDILTYANERQRECTELSLDGSAIRAAEEAGSDGQRGRLLGAAYMTNEAYIEVHEVVVIEDEHLHREAVAPSAGAQTPDELNDRGSGERDPARSWPDSGDDGPAR